VTVYLLHYLEPESYATRQQEANLDLCGDWLKLA